jgi:hypothetical protein
LGRRSEKEGCENCERVKKEGKMGKQMMKIELLGPGLIFKTFIVYFMKKKYLK